jgi:hypothetical protein
MAVRRAQSIGELTYLQADCQGVLHATKTAASARPHRPSLDRMRAT